MEVAEVLRGASLALLAVARRLNAQLGDAVRCERCDRLFAPARRDARYCSDACRQAASRARRHAATGHPHS